MQAVKGVFQYQINFFSETCLRASKIQSLYLLRLIFFSDHQLFPLFLHKIGKFREFVHTFSAEFPGIWHFSQNIGTLGTANFCLSSRHGRKARKSRVSQVPGIPAKYLCKKVHILCTFPLERVKKGVYRDFCLYPPLLKTRLF